MGRVDFIFRVLLYFMAVSLLSMNVMSCAHEVTGDDDGGSAEGGETGVPVSMEKACIMDIVFSRNGTAEDVSENANIVRSSIGNTVLIYYNGAFGGYVPRFFNSQGEDISSGFYRAEYLADRDFKAAVQQGFTLETMFMLDVEPESDRMAVFSSVESGGMGVSVGSAVSANEILFELNTGTEDSPRVVTLRSGITPEKGKVYHVAGSWNREEQIARLYVNGELKAEFGTSGELVLPDNPADQWFGIGCDAGTSSKGQYPMKGDVYIARVYSHAADAAQAAALWSDADNDIESSIVSIGDILLFPTCKVAPGYRYMVLGTGFLQGDRMKFVPVSDMDSPLEVSGEVYEGHITALIPEEVADGDYHLYVVRDGVEAPLGTARLETAENPAPLAAPGIVAHRGYHILPGTAENSIAALKASQELGVYGCEIDVWITTDGEVAVHHDGVLSGMTIQDCTYDQVKDLKLSNGETLPLLRDMLEEAAKSDVTKLVIEIKEHSSDERNVQVTEAVLDIVGKMDADDHVEYICFDRDVCRMIAENRPDAIVGYLTGDAEPSALAAEGIMCIDYPFSTLNRYGYMVEEAHSLGMKANIWTVNTDEDMMTSIAIGVDYITTDYPDRLMEIYVMMEE